LLPEDARVPNELIYREVSAPPVSGDLREFVLSDNQPDRYQDIIEASAWELGPFLQNPVALFSHDAAKPIGTWEGVRVAGNQLRGRLKLVRQGVSDFTDMIRALVEEGVLRAVSVGFLGRAKEPRENKGYCYTKAELIEVSLVATPANPCALAVAKSLGMSPSIEQ
jgi:HK97 family phage prohead protease